MALVNGIHSEITAMRNAVASGLATATGAYEHAGRIAAEANRIGFLGVGRRVLAIQQMIATVRAAMAAAANQLTDARATVATATGRPTPQHLVDALTRVQATLTAVRDTLSATASTVTDAHQEITETLRGAQPGPMRARLEAIGAALTFVVGRCEHTDHQVTTALLEARQLGDHGTVDGSVGAVVAPPPLTVAPVIDPRPYLDQMPRREPPRRGQPRQKTHGRRVRADGPAEALISGESGADYDLARKRAWDIGVAPHPWAFNGASHVEIKMASRMHAEWQRTGQPQHETIVINNQPCAEKELDCEYVIDLFLPPDSTLQVYGTDEFEKLYGERSLDA